MKKKTTFLKSLLVAAGLLAGVNGAWADVTPFSETYSSTSTAAGWSSSVGGRFTPTIMSEGDNYFLTVAQGERNNNGCVVTGNVINGKAAAGDDFTLIFDLRLGSHSDKGKGAATFDIKDAAGSSSILLLADKGANSTSWNINGSTTDVTLPGSSSQSGTGITNITWCTFKISRSGVITYLTITNKETDDAILERTIISGSSATGGLGNIVFNTSRYNAEFAIDNIVVREIQSGDVPDAAPTTVTVKFVDADGNTLKDDVVINTVEGSSVTADEYTVAFTEAGKKYIYVSGNETITADADESKNVITLVFREAGTWAYSILAIDASKNVLSTLATGSAFEGDNASVAYPLATNIDGVWYETTRVNDYRRTMNESHPTDSVVYTSSNRITYFFDNADYIIENKRDDGYLPERGASNYDAVRVGAGGYIYTPTVNAGTYTLTLNKNNSNSSDQTLQIWIRDAEGNAFYTGKNITQAQNAYYTESSVEGVVVPEGYRIMLKNNTTWNSNMSIDYIILKKTGEAIVPVAVSTYGKSTFSSKNALVFNEDAAVKAWIAKSVTDGVVTLERVKGAVAANTGLVVTGSTADVPVAVSGTAYGENLLVAVAENTEVTEGYVLSVQSESVVFAPVGATAATVEAGHAYLAASAGSKALTLSFAGNETTGINSVNAEQKAANEFFNLAGQRVAAPQKGLYILNGKKVIVK